LSGDTKTITKWLEAAKRDYDELGGWRAFKSGEWLGLLIHRSFNAYWEQATAEYFHAKYPKWEVDKIAKRLIAVAAKNASILGGITGATISADEIVQSLPVAGVAWVFPQILV
jgi:hypothetical protein